MSTPELLDLKQEALSTFLIDLPQLYADHPGMWIAYQGRQQIGLGKQKHELYRECYRRGLQNEEFVIFCIESQETELTLGPVVWD